MIGLTSEWPVCVGIIGVRGYLTVGEDLGRTVVGEGLEGGRRIVTLKHNQAIPVGHLPHVNKYLVGILFEYAVSGGLGGVFETGTGGEREEKWSRRAQ